MSFSISGQNQLIRDGEAETRNDMDIKITVNNQFKQMPYLVWVFTAGTCIWICAYKVFGQTSLCFSDQLSQNQFSTLVNIMI